MRLHGDDAAVLGVDLLEQLEQQLPALGWLRLDLPEAGEVREDRAGAVDRGLGGRAAPANAQPARAAVSPEALAVTVSDRLNLAAPARAGASSCAAKRLASSRSTFPRSRAPSCAARFTSARSGNLSEQSE